MDTKKLRPLLSALDVGYQFRPHEMLGFFLSATMDLWGLPQWRPVPKDVQPQITEAIEIYADLVAVEEPFMDIIGPVYMDLASRGARSQLAQFFTPWEIAEMMARMTVGEQPKDTHALHRVCDPACGSGVMLLAFANEVMKSWGEDSLRRLSVTGCDLDAYCARMFAVQFIANCNIHQIQLGEVLVFQGNSLLPWEGLETVLHATAPGIAGLPPPQAPERLAALHAAGQSHPDVVQLRLFAA